MILATSLSMQGREFDHKQDQNKFFLKMTKLYKTQRYVVEISVMYIRGEAFWE